MTKPFPLRRTVLVASLLLGAASALAQESRDPTVAPPETGATMMSPTGVEGMTVLVRDDKPYLVVGTRLYAPGDTVGNLRVERITETEVWFHDGTALTKVPRFAGIQRKPAIVKLQCGAMESKPTAQSAGTSPASPKRKAKKRSKSGPSSVATSPPPAAAPCEDTPP